MSAAPQENRFSDFPREQFTIRLFCDACGHQADLDRETVLETMTIQKLTQHLRCTECDSRECSIRIVYSGAGGFR